MASKLSETQPYPVKPPPFTRQTFTEDMVTNRTPEAHAAVLAKLRKLDSNGMFTPPSLRGTVLFPGTDGGGEWGGAAFDPETGLLYVNSNEQPWIIRMVTHDTKSLYKNNCASCHGTIAKAHRLPFLRWSISASAGHGEELIAIISAKARDACRASLTWAATSERLSIFC